MSYAERELPANVEAEAAIVSALAWQPKCAADVFDMLDGDDFTDDVHRRLFEAAHDLFQRNTPITSVNLVVLLKERGDLMTVGGISAISAIIDSAPAVGHVEAHAKLLRDKTRLRRFIRECTLALGEAYAAPRDVGAFLNEAEQRIYTATAESSRSQARWIGELAQAEGDHILAVRAGASLPTGVPYGLAGLDAMIGGMRSGEVTVVAARPGMGKTSLGANIAIAAAAGNHGGVTQGVLFVSLEMTSGQVVRRTISSRSRSSYRDLLSTAKVPDGSEAYERFVETVDGLIPLPIKLEDTTRMKPSQVRSLIRRTQSTFNKPNGVTGREQKLSVVVIDYLQRMGADRARKERFTEVADNMNAVADMAKELGVHVVLLAQVNRENTKRDGKSKRPRMSDLAESGEIEKSAHNIVMLHRPEYYVQDKRQVPDHERGLAELIVEKQREGRTGIAFAAFDAEHTLFRDPTEDEIDRWAAVPDESPKARAPQGWRR